jgi:sulfur carrier protein
VNVVVNGEPRVLSNGITVADVVAAAGSPDDGRGIAVAVNGEVVTRSQWRSRRLSDHDRIEILRAVGGG